MPRRACRCPLRAAPSPSTSRSMPAQDLPRGDRVGVELGRVVGQVRLQRAELRRALAATSCLARCTAGSAAAAGPAAEVAQRRLDRRLRPCSAGRSARSSELLFSSTRTPRAARRSRPASSAAPLARRGCDAFVIRFAPALGLRDAVRELLRLRDRGAGAAAAIWSEPRPPGPRPAPSGSRRAPCSRPRFRRAGAAQRAARSPRSSRAELRPPVTIWRVMLRSTAVRSSSDAGPSTASTPGCARDPLLEALQRAQPRVGRDRARCVWKVDLERRRPAGAAIALERLVALARRVVGRQVRDVGRPGVERQRGRRQQQQREASRAAPRRPACATAARRAAPRGSRRAPDHSCQRLTFVAEHGEAGGYREQRRPATASTHATITPIVADTSSAPGAISSAPSIPTASAVPANTTVRPARTTASSTASATLRPAASSSRKRETISSE